MRDGNEWKVPGIWLETGGGDGGWASCVLRTFIEGATCLISVPDWWRDTHMQTKIFVWSCQTQLVQLDEGLVLDNHNTHMDMTSNINIKWNPAGPKYLLTRHQQRWQLARSQWWTWWPNCVTSRHNIYNLHGNLLSCYSGLTWGMSRPWLSQHTMGRFSKVWVVTKLYVFTSTLSHISQAILNNPILS